LIVLQILDMVAELIRCRKTILDRLDSAERIRREVLAAKPDNAARASG
jgi:hypothetical protein